MTKFLLNLMLFVATKVVVIACIYPDDHWIYSTKLTTDNYAEKNSIRNW